MTVQEKLREIKQIINDEIRDAVMDERAIEIDTLKLNVVHATGTEHEVVIERIGRVTKPHNRALRFSLQNVEYDVFAMLKAAWKEEGISPDQALERLRK